MRKKSYSANASRGRDVLTISQPSLAMLPRVVYLPPVLRHRTYFKPEKGLLNVQGDRRRFNPTRSVSGAFASSKEAAEVVHRGSYRSSVWGVGFRTPRKVSICQRRDARRSVLHALGVAGSRGVGKGKSRRTNFWSEVKC